MGYYLRSIFLSATDVGRVLWPQLAVASVVLARPVKCCNCMGIVGMLWSTRSWRVYGTKVCVSRLTISKQGPRSVRDRCPMKQATSDRESVCEGVVVSVRSDMSSCCDKPLSFCDAALSNALAWIYFSVMCEYTVTKMKHSISVNAESAESA